MMNAIHVPPRRLVVLASLVLCLWHSTTHAFAPRVASPRSSLPRFTPASNFRARPRFATTSVHHLHDLTGNSTLFDSLAANSTETMPTEESSSQQLLPAWEPWGRGVVRDFSNRLAYYRTDVLDGCNVQAVSTTSFLLLACLAPAVGFGGLYATATAGHMGPVEALVSTAVSGVLFSATAAQPAAILGATGPILAFTAALVPLAQAWQVPFLPLYAWTGLWTAGLLGTVAMTSASNRVQSWTKFTDETFATLVSLIFISQAGSNLWQAVTTGAPTVWHAIVTGSLAVTTFTLTRVCKNARQWKHWGTRSVRNTLSNFAPTVGVVASCLLAAWARSRHGLQLATLALPATFGTTSGRPWMVPLMSLPVWARWAAAVPAAMATLVLFFEHAITHRLMNSPKYHMKKGRSHPENENNHSQTSLLDGMHADAGVMAVLVALQSLFGLPWLTAATVRSLSHVQALERHDAVTGQSMGVMEQRVTNAAIHIVMGALVVCQAPRQWLTRTVPPAALMGLFFYMGLSTLTSGNQLWSRFTGLFQKSTTTPGSRNDRVPKRFVRRLTAVNIACLTALFALTKSKSLGVLFPVVLGLLPPLRNALVKSNFIPKAYMKVLEEDS